MKSLTPIEEQEQAALLRALQEQGLAIKELYELNFLELPTEVASIFEEAIQRSSSLRVRDTAVQFLSDLKKTPDLYLRELQELHALSPNCRWRDEYAWTLAERLRTSARPKDYDAIVKLLGDPELGVARQMLVYALLRDKSRRGETVQLLTGMIADQDVTVQILDALGRLKAEEAIPVLERFADSSDSNHRREARKALRKLGRVRQPKTTGFRVRDGEALVEISGNFDAESVASLLETTALLTHDQLQQLEETLDSMDVEEETELEFVVPTAEGEARLSIGIFLADVDAPDVRFRSAPHVIAKLEREMGD